MRKTIVALIILLTPLFAFAQFKTQAKPMSFSDQMKSGQAEGFGILGLDPSRFSMHHSYSMSYASIGGKGFTQGLYLNTMTYRFAFPLTVSLQLGIANNPLQSANTASILQNGFFVSGAQVRYQPSKNTILEFNFRQTPYRNFPGYYGYGTVDSGFDWFE